MPFPQKFNSKDRKRHLLTGCHNCKDGKVPFGICDSASRCTQPVIPTHVEVGWRVAKLSFANTVRQSARRRERFCQLDCVEATNLIVRSGQRREGDETGLSEPLYSLY